MLFTLVFSVDEDIIEVYYHKNVELFCQDLVDIALEGGWCIGLSERHNLVLKVAIASFKGRFLFISFPDPHSIVNISQIKLGKLLSLT